MEEARIDPVWRSSQVRPMRTGSIRFVFLLAILQPESLRSPRFPEQAAGAPSVSPATNRSRGGPTKAVRAVASPGERRTFIEAMVKRGDPAIAPTIARFIEDPDPGVAAAACWAIGELRNRETSSQAVRGLQDNSMPVVRATCALAVGRIGDLQNVPALNAAASNDKEETDVRLASIQALAMFDTEQGSGLIPLLKNSDPRIRASAAYSACQLQVPAAV